MPTLALAKRALLLWDFRTQGQREREDAARRLVERYPTLDLAEVVHGVPVVRMKPAFVEVMRYDGGRLPKGVRLHVLSRFADPQALAGLYWDTCEREGLPRHSTSPGCLSWRVDRMHLVVDVGPREEIHPARVEQLAAYPQVLRFAFPLDTVVRTLLLALLGQGQAKNQMFAGSLV